MFEFRQIEYTQAVEFLLPRHYSGRIPSITYAFGLFKDEELKAVCTFGKPASPTLCDGICGKEYSQYVYELNRLCRTDDLDFPLSQFVGWCLRQLKPLNLIIVSYSDSGMNHHGYIYQSCNFYYTGMTKQRTDKWTPNGKHSRHYKNEEQGEYRKVRTAKYRYIYFCADKKTKKEYLLHLKYKIENEYPKGDNSNYILGEYQKDILVKINT